MKSYSGTYLLSPIDHKGTYELTEDITIQIEKSYENNLRERNSQLGRVEAVCDDNPHNLTVGDIVSVNHRTFYGNIGENRSFIEKDHVVLDGVKMFRALPEQIFFKYNNKIPEMLGDFFLCNGVQEKTELKLEANADLNFVRTKEFAQRGFITHGDIAVGTEVLVLKNAFYLITLDRVDYFKVRKDEIVATIEHGVATPTFGNAVIEYLSEIEHPFLDLSMMKKPNYVTAKVISGEITPPMYVSGQDGLLQVYRNNGVPFGNQWVINSDHVIFQYEEA